MSGMTIEETFEARAPKERVYAFLNDPAQCFPCLPGATFGSMHPDGTFDGKISVAVGPVKVSYDGWAVYDEEDAEAGRLVLRGEGRETGGGGIVKMNMTCTVTETDGVSRVDVVAEVGLAGKIIRFGRGLVRSIASQVFQDFTTRARARLENADATAPPPTADADPFGGGQADPFGGDAAADPFGGAPADPFGSAPAPAPDALSPPTSPPPQPAPAATADETPTVAPQPPAPAPAEDNAPANGLALLFRALWSMIAGLFGFGRR